MEMFLYLIIAAVLYGVLADRTDRAVEREMQKRRADAPDLRLVEEFDARPDLGPWYGRILRRTVRSRAGARPAATPPVHHRA